MKFSQSKKGYNIAEVDDYVMQAEQALNAQKERIAAQKKKIAAYESELDIYHEKKDLIMAALTEAVKKAEEIERQANQKYDLEIQRLRQFHAKWTEHYDKLFQKYPISLSSASEFNSAMDKILAETEWDTDQLAQKEDELYKKESARLIANAQQAFSQNDEQGSQHLAQKAKTPLERIKKYLDGTGGDEDGKKGNLPSEEGVFSLEEALHPKQDLVGIMKDLGLIFED